MWAVATCFQWRSVQKHFANEISCYDKPKKTRRKILHLESPTYRFFIFNNLSFYAFSGMLKNGIKWEERK